MNISLQWCIASNGGLVFVSLLLVQIIVTHGAWITPQSTKTNMVVVAADGSHRCRSAKTTHLHHATPTSSSHQTSQSVVSSPSPLPPPSPPPPLPVGVEMEEAQFQLSTGISMQAFYCLPPDYNNKSTNVAATTKSQKPVLLFLHGSFHASWCWTEKFFPYFVNQGYAVVALSWRGTGGTFAGEGVTKVQLDQHANDLDAFWHEALPRIVFGKAATTTTTQPPPPVVLIAHSFGSLAVMKCLEMHPAYATSSQILAGVVAMNAVPPSGNRGLVRRYLRRRPLVDSWRITSGLAMKKCISNAALARQLFFELGGAYNQAPPDNNNDDGDGENPSTITSNLDDGVSEADLARYQSYFARDTAATIDMLDFVKVAPSKRVDDEGRALFLQDALSSSSSSRGEKSPFPVLVLSGKDDFIVDREASCETSRYFGGEGRITTVDAPHDAMLGSQWQNAAEAIAEWLEREVVP